jgi:proteic killer suppression protein
MEVEFEDENLRRLASDPLFDIGIERGIVKAFRMRVQVIAAAEDERVFYKLTSWNFEKLKGDLLGKYSIRLNKQWRLLIRLEKKDSGKIVVIISICDYH